MPQVLAQGRAGLQHAADLHARGGRHALLHGAPSLRRRPAVPAGARQRHPASSAPTRRLSRPGTRPAATSFKAGDLVRVTLTFRLTKERRFVAVTDPLPAGFEAVESWFATTARRSPTSRIKQGERGDDWLSWWRAAASITSSATTIASSSSRRGCRRAPHVHLRRSRDDGRHVPDGAGARGGDVRAGSLRTDGDAVIEVKR